MTNTEQRTYKRHEIGYNFQWANEKEKKKEKKTTIRMNFHHQKRLKCTIMKTKNTLRTFKLDSDGRARGTCLVRRCVAILWFEVDVTICFEHRLAWTPFNFNDNKTFVNSRWVIASNRQKIFEPHQLAALNVGCCENYFTYFSFAILDVKLLFFFSFTFVTFWLQKGYNLAACNWKMNISWLKCS